MNKEELINGLRIAAKTIQDLGGDGTLQECVQLQALLKEVSDGIKAVNTEINKEYDRLRLGKVPELMDEQGITNVAYEEIGRVSLEADVYASIPAASKVEAYEYLQDNGHGDVVVETVNAGTLKSLAKKLLKDGEPLPEELFKVTPFTRAKITRN